MSELENVVEETETESNGVETVDVSASVPTPEGDGTIEGTDAANAKGKEQLVDFDRIVADHSRNPRLPSKYTADGPAGEKARSIWKHGLLNPLVVSKRRDGSIVVLQGHLRFGGITLIRTTGLPAIGKDVGTAIPATPSFMQKVKCRVLEGLSLSDELDLLMDHGTQTPLEKREYYVAAKTMLRAGFTEDLIAEKLGFKSRGPASVLVRVARMPECVEAAYMADPKSESYFPVTDTTINDLFKVYNAEQKRVGSRVKVGGTEFNASWEKVVGEGNAPRIKSLATSEKFPARFCSEGTLMMPVSTPCLRRVAW